MVGKIVHVHLYKNNQLALHSIQSSHLGMITVSKIIKLKWTLKTTLYETEAEPQKQHFLEQLVEFYYYEVTSGALSLTDVQSTPLIREFSDIFLDMNNYLQTSRNSTLWIKYMDMVDILSQFFGNLKIHLQATHDILANFTTCEQNHVIHVPCHSSKQSFLGWT